MNQLDARPTETIAGAKQGNKMKALDEIKKMMSSGDTARAAEALKELLAKEPQNLQAKMLYGTCCQLLGDEETFKRIRELLFTGGEPLIRSDLFKLLAYARAQLPEARLEVYTNGSLLSEIVLRRFKRLKVHLSTSLQGLRTYGEMTGTRRTFARTLEFIGRAAELKWPVSVGVSITSRNLHEACDMVAAVAVAGAGVIQVSPMMAEGRGRARIDLMLSRKEWRHLKMKIKAMPTGDIPVVFCDEMFCDCRRQPSALRRAYVQRNRTECPAGRLFAVFGPDGRLRRCLHTLD